MKARNIKHFISVTMALMSVACVDENMENDVPSGDNSTGVYFVEEHENIKTHTLTKGQDKTTLEFAVRRTDVEQEEYVSFDIEAYTIAKEQYTDTSYRETRIPVDELFEFSEIYFEAGERETTLQVWFDDIEIGKLYNCSISINDPEHVSDYQNNASSISFAVQMFDWKYIGKAIYRDALFSDMFLWDGRYLETEVDIYERTDEDGKGYYRLKDVYSAEYVARLVEGDEAFNEDPEKLTKEYEDYIEKDTYIVINATDPEKVYVPLQKTGFSDPSMGDIMIASDVTEVWGAGSNLLYGTLKEGVITFDKNGLLVSLGQYFYFSNSSGKARIVLPGGNGEDYYLELKADEIDSENRIPVTFTPAKDVKKVRYAIFEGQVGGLEVDNKISQINDKKVEVVEIELAGEETLQISLNNGSDTGLYTLIACTYNEMGEYEDYASAILGYVKPGDGRDVNIGFDVIVSDYYASENAEEDYNAQNSFEYRVWGKGITHIMFNYYSLSYYNSYKEKIEDELKKAGSVDNSTLKILNERGLSGVVGNDLKAGTDYIFVVYAGNGYHYTFKTLEFKTEGTEDIMQKSFWYKDFLPQTSTPEMYTEHSWVAVSTDIFNSTTKGRTIRGNGRKVQFSYNDGKMTASGLFPSLNVKLENGKLQQDPDIEFDFADGCLYTTYHNPADIQDVYVKDSTHLVPSMRLEYRYKPLLGSISGSGYFYDNYEVKENNVKVEKYDMIRAGFVHEQIIAFTDNNTENNFWALVLGGYVTTQKEVGKEGEEGYKPWEGNLANFVGDAHGDLILVRDDCPLLQNLESSDSKTTLTEGEKLNSVTESNRVDMPAIGSILKNIKEADIAYDKVSFSQERTALLDIRKGVHTKTFVK